MLYLVDFTIFVSGFGFLVLAGYALLSRVSTLPPIISHYTFLVYTIPVFLFISTALDRILRHPAKVHKARLEDRSEVKRLFHDPAIQEQSEPLIDHLKSIGHNNWTDYMVLPLRQLIVEKADPSRLVPMARTILSDLQEYADDPKFLYDEQLYKVWKTQIDEAIKKYAEDTQSAEAERTLRAIISTTYEHLTDYEMKWAQGSVMVSSLFRTVAVGTVVMIFCGLLPFLYFDQELGIVNWAVLGSAGGLMAALWQLWNSDETEVGHTEGRQAIARAVGGGALGVMVGFVVYGAAAAGLLPTTLAPDLVSHKLPDIGKSLLWAIFAGFFIDVVVDKIIGRFGSEISGAARVTGD